MNDVLVLGSGITGSVMACSLARAGVNVHLVEKQADIGGHVREMGCKAADACLRCNVCVADEVLRSVRTRSGISIHTSSELLELRPGRNGARYRAVLGCGGSRGDEIDVDSVVVAIGHSTYDARENCAYGYGSIPNVITGLDAERQLSEIHTINRPSDGQPPRRIAFVQCVGSRTDEVCRQPGNRAYCSTVCCAYALRMARHTKFRAEASDIAIYYMDIQQSGKSRRAFYGNCREEIRFIRSRPSELQRKPGETVGVKYVSEEGAVRVDEFDLVILSVGIRPPADGVSLGKRLRVAMDEHGFFGVKSASSMSDTQKEGIFAAGSCASPKDIAGCIAQAQAVSAIVLQDLSVRTGARSGPTRKTRKKNNICTDVAVVGTGIAGMQAALSLAELGCRTTLVGRSRELGGIAPRMSQLYGYLAADSDEAARGVERFTAELIDEVESNKSIRLLMGASRVSVEGEQGNFLVSVKTEGKREQFGAGAVVLATGAPRGSGSRGTRSSVIVGMDRLLERMRAGNVGIRVAMVLDVEHNQARTPFAQVISAAELLARRYDTQVEIYCRDVQVAATGMEALYCRARQAGVMVTRYDGKPTVSEKGSKGVITCQDSIAGLEVSEEFDLIAMADVQSGVASTGVSGLVAGLRPGVEGQLQYDNVWLFPGLTNRPGVFVAGGARGDSEYREALTDALAVANEVHALLVGSETHARNDTATVDGDRCVLCLTCMRVCPHGAVTIDKERNAASPSPVSCQRCGICVSECPVEAISLPGFTDEDMAVAIGSKPQLTIFACENSAVPAAEAATPTYPGSVKVIKVPCAGQVDSRMVLKALESGASKVVILGCHPESCRYLSGSSRAARRINRLAEMLTKAGFDGSRVAFGGMSSVEPGRFEEYLRCNGQ